MRRYQIPPGLAAVRDWPLLARQCEYRAGRVAERCGVSLAELRSFCCRVVKRPAKRWLRELRLAQAEAWLAEDLSAPEVARRLYFSDTTHFYHEFQRLRGRGVARWRAWRRNWAETEGFMPAVTPPLLPVVEPEERALCDEDFVWLGVSEWLRTEG